MTRSHWMTPATNDRATAADASGPANRPMRFPASSRTMDPISGNKMMKGARFALKPASVLGVICSPLQQAHIVDRGSTAPSKDRHDDRETHDDFRGRYNEDEKHKDLTVDVAPHPSE